MLTAIWSQWHFQSTNQSINDSTHIVTVKVEAVVKCSHRSSKALFEQRAIVIANEHI